MVNEEFLPRGNPATGIPIKEVYEALNVGTLIQPSDPGWGRFASLGILTFPHRSIEELLTVSGAMRDEK
jgi:hypothetical protein